MTAGPPGMEEIKAAGQELFPGLLGVQFEEIDRGGVRSFLAVQPVHLAPNGYLHAAVVVGLADTSCGYGTMASLPEGAVGFATIELKTNFLGTALDGVIGCEAIMTHGGRTTQVWDATVSHVDTGKVIALFRCTQLLIAEGTRGAAAVSSRRPAPR
jgi:1,4-dihydroxy-2-naphthoyl-CoA hydrolase